MLQHLLRLLDGILTRRPPTLIVTRGIAILVTIALWAVTVKPILVIIIGIRISSAVHIVAVTGRLVRRGGGGTHSLPRRAKGTGTTTHPGQCYRHHPIPLLLFLGWERQIIQWLAIIFRCITIPVKRTRLRAPL